MMIYASIAIIQPNAYIGVETDFPKWLILKNTFFLATETTAALGTGSIFANPFIKQGVGFIPVWINSVETILLFTIIGWGISRRIDRYTDKKERIVRAKKSKLKK